MFRLPRHNTHVTLNSGVNLFNYSCLPFTVHDIQPVPCFYVISVLVNTTQVNRI